jgi:hypothetical protein
MTRTPMRAPMPTGQTRRGWASARQGAASIPRAQASRLICIISTRWQREGLGKLPRRGELALSLGPVARIWGV